MKSAVPTAVFLALLFAFASAIFDFQESPEHCQKDKAVRNTYSPKGHYIVLDNMTIYETDGGNPSKVLILVYDIFGFHNNTNEIADRMSQEHGFKVAIPDFFRDSNITRRENWPPNDPKEVTDFLSKNADWNATVEKDMRTVATHYYSRGANAMGVFGFCWGGKIGTLSATFLSDIFNGSAIIHPSGVSTPEADNVLIPMYLMPASNDPNLLPFYMTLQRKPFGTQCRHRRYDDMTHGFCGARGNFSNPLNKLRVDEVVLNMGTFFNATMF